MKIRLILLTLALAIAVPVFAADLPKESYEIRIEGSYDVDDGEDDCHVSPLGGLGYYFTDDILVGGYLSFEKHIWESYWGVSDVWGLGVYGEWNINYGDAMVPYLGMSLGVESGDEDSATVGCATVGLKVFLTETVMVNAAFNMNWSNEDIYDYDRLKDIDNDGEEEIVNEGESTDITATIGIRFLLF